MRSIKSLDDAQIVVREILEQIKLVKSAKDWDFKGLRIKNASPAVDPNDYVTLSQLGSTTNGSTSVTNIISGGGSGSTKQDLQTDVTLVAGANAISAPPIFQVGDKLTVILTTPHTGLAAITWNANFKNVTSNDLDSRIDKTNVYRFEARGDSKWWLVSMLLGR